MISGLKQNGVLVLNMIADHEETAQKIFEILTSPSAINYYSSLIFWDEKRPIKSSILNTLNLTALIAAEESFYGSKGRSKINL